MNSNKMTLAAIFTLLILIGGAIHSRAGARTGVQLPPQPMAASQRGEYALAEASL